MGGKLRSGVFCNIVIPIQHSIMGKIQSCDSETLTSGTEGAVSEACLERCVSGQRKVLGNLGSPDAAVQGSS